MKKLLTAILFLASLCLNAATYYVSPSGSDSNPGTITLPWKTWQKAFSSLAPGDILYIRGGNYTDMYDSGHGVFIQGHNGNSSSPITVSSYPGEAPVLDCSSLSVSSGVNFGILMRSCNYWNISGLTVKNVREYNNLSQSSGGSPVEGWEIGDCSNISMSQCIVTNCGNGFSLNGTVNNIKYKNCDSFGNYDYYDNGGLANGFNGNMRGGSTVTYEGCRAWSNSDDGYDDYGGAGYITYKNCWASGNGKGVPTSGNGDGFKLGYDNSSTELSGSQRTLYNCVSADNTLMGFDESMDGTTSMDMEIYNCIAYNNTRDYGFRFSVTYGTGVTTLKNNIAYGNGINYAGRTRNISNHNTWDSGAPSVSNADFTSLDVSQLLRSRKSDGSLPDVDFSHLATGSDLIDAGTNIGLAFLGNAPDLGAFESGSTPVPTVQVVTYQSSSVKSTNASQVEVIYDHTLSTVAPSASAYEIKVNSTVRTISNLSISGQNVYLNLSSPVISGDVVSLSYTKPATNPLTCTSGTQAESISAKSVTNLVQAVAAPVLTGAVINNETPAQIQLTYGESLAGTVPPVSAYSAIVNRVAASVQSVAVQNNTVTLTMASALHYKDTVTVSYTRPATNPLQSSAGGFAASFSNKSVVNNIVYIAPPTTDPGPVADDSQINITPNPSHGYIEIKNFVPGSQESVLKLYDFSGKLCQEIKIVNYTQTTQYQTTVPKGVYIAQLYTGTIERHVQKLIILIK